VTKGHPVEAVRAALAAGLDTLGENRVGELAGKRAAVPDAARWHLIGHLQRNKVRQALPLLDLLHSLDSLRLASEIAREAERAGLVVPVLLQVNASGEGTKGGFEVEAVEEIAGKLTEVPTLRVQGLMTMAPYTDEAQVLRDTFRRTREAFDRCAALRGFEGRYLSMGMSNDFEIAVEEGSTMVRLGTTLFGERVQ
jgi:pyridoxal phosphate enzyme (YggS family)